MAKKRERLEVIHDILAAVRDHGNKIKPTRLLHASNLSPQMFRDYIEELLRKGFLTEQILEGQGFRDGEAKKQYSLKTKGFEFLERYKTIIELIENFGL